MLDILCYETYKELLKNTTIIMNINYNLENTSVLI
jgi:hypothetical protein